jgi:hypothetical protein
VPGATPVVEIELTLGRPVKTRTAIWLHSKRTATAITLWAV